MQQELLIEVLRTRDEAESSITSLVQIAGENMEYYFGTKPLPDCEGGLTITDKIVYSHVEGAVAQILPIFTSTENKAIKFTPYNNEDVMLAEALTDHISKSILFKNRGKEVLENAIRESFINRISWIKTTWDKSQESEQSSFREITKAQLKKLKREHDKVVVTDKTDDGYTGYYIDYNLEEHLSLVNVPLEQLVFDVTARNLDDLTYIAQKTTMTRAELYDMFDKKKVDELGSNGIQDMPNIANIDGFTSTDDINVGNTMIDKFLVYEHYIKTTDGDDNTLRWKQVFTINNELMEEQVVTGHPFSPIVPVPHVNSLVGYSFADLLKDIQIQRTKLLRAAVDNTMVLAYPRYQAVDGQYDEESLLNNVAGAVIAVQTMDSVKPFAETVIPSDVYNHIERLGNEAQKLTGISEMNQGLDPNVLGSTNAAATVIAQMNAGSKRVLTYGRNIAEGWKVVLRKAYDYIRENSNKLVVTDYNGKKFIIKESQLQERELGITPALGTDENTQQATMLIQLAERYKADESLSKAYNSYQMEMMILDALGIPNRHLILQDPATIMPTQQEIMLQQMQMQQMQLELAKLQGLVQNLTMDVQVKQFGMQLDTSKLQLEQTKVIGEQEYNAEKIVTDRGKLDIEAQRVGIENYRLQQDGEIAAQKAHMEDLRMRHDAAKDLAEMMSRNTEIAMETTQQRPVKFG